MDSMQPYVERYRKLCVEFYTIQAQLTSLRNIRGSIDPDRYEQQESEYNTKLDHLEPQINDTKEIIANAISEQKAGKEQIDKKIAVLESKINQEEVLLEARAISRERYENIVKPLKNELVQLQLDERKIRENINTLEKALLSCNEEAAFTMGNDAVLEIHPEEVKVETIEMISSNAKAWAMGVYVSYLVGFLLWVTPIVGLIIAYVFQDKAGAVLESHYRFQIRTFWISILFGIITFILVFVLIGFLLLPVIAIWYIIRCVVGIKYLSENKPIPNPGSWLFGL